MIYRILSDELLRWVKWFGAHIVGLPRTDPESDGLRLISDMLRDTYHVGKKRVGIEMRVVPVGFARHILHPFDAIEGKGEKQLVGNPRGKEEPTVAILLKQMRVEEKLL